MHTVIVVPADLKMGDVLAINKMRLRYAGLEKTADGFNALFHYGDTDTLCVAQSSPALKNTAECFHVVFADTMTEDVEPLHDVS